MRAAICAAVLFVASFANAAQVAITRYPTGMMAVVGEAVTDSFDIANAGPDAASISIVANRTFFDVAPASLTLATGDSATITIRPNVQQGGFYEGASNVFVNGSTTPLAVPVRLFLGQQPQGVVNPVPATSFLVTSGFAGAPHPGTFNVSNRGNVTMQGMLVGDASWIAPQSGITPIPANQNAPLPFVADPSQRPDAAYPLGAALGELSMLYLRGTAPSAEESGAVTATVIDFSKVSVVPQEPPASAAGESISFLPGITDTFGFFTDVFVSNRSGATLPSDLKLFFTPAGAPAATSLLANIGKLPSTSAAWFPQVPSSIFNVGGQTGTIQVRTPDATKVSIAALRGTDDGVNRYLTAMPILNSDRSVRAGDRLLFAGVEKSSAAHTDFYLQETSGFSGNYTIDFFGANGAPIAPSRNGALLAFGFLTLADAVPAGARSASLTNSSSGAAHVNAFALVVDESTHDSFSVVDASRGPSPTTDLILPVPMLTGAPSGSTFDVWITNGSSSAASVSIGSVATPVKDRAARRNGSASPTTTVTQLAAHETRKFTMTNTPAGFVHVSGAPGVISASGRFTSTASGRGGSFGTGVPAIPSARAAGPGTVKRFARANDVQNFSPPSLMLLEVAGQPAKVRVTVRFTFRATASTSGQAEASRDYDVAANTRFVIPDAIRSIFGPARDNLGMLTNVVMDVEVVSGDGRILPYLQTIDASGDVTFSAD